MTKETIFKGYDKISDSWVYGMPVRDSVVKGRWWIMFNESEGVIIDDPETIKVDEPEYCECAQIDGTWDIKGIECCIDCGFPIASQSKHHE